MARLNLQDSVFLRLESRERPFHIAGLALCTAPPGAPAGYLRDLAARLKNLPELFPAFRKKLGNPSAIRQLDWVEATDYDPSYHVFHYALPAPGNRDDLIALISRAHERLLDRTRPLWEVHLIEGLEDQRFAFYCKFHHAIVDGVGALRMVRQLFSAAADTRLETHRPPPPGRPASERGLLRQLSELTGDLMEQGKAIPELYSMLGTMGKRGWTDRESAPPLPFTAPHALFNQEITADRSIVTLELPLTSVRKIGAGFGGTINDALVAICGGALRAYLLDQHALPDKSLLAGIPVAVEPSGKHKGNQLSTMICPFGTDLDDPAERIRRVIHVTQQAKDDLQHLTRVASQDYMNLLLIPGLVLTLAGAATRVPPPFNVIISNVPGPHKPQYFHGASVDHIFPLSLITDAQGLNITAVSYENKLCLGIVACPSFLPGIKSLDERIKRAHRDLRALV